MDKEPVVKKAYLEMNRQDWRQLLDAQLLCGILATVTILTGVFTKLLSSRESVQATLEPYLNIIRVATFGLLLLGQIPYVQAEIHVRFKRSCCVLAAIACYSAGELAVKGLVHNAVALVRVGRATVLKVQCVEHELHVLVRILLLVSC